MRITVHGRGAHGSMPQAAVDPVVLAAMIVVRLQTVVSREVAPGETAVLTVGSIQAGTKSNVIPDPRVLQLNVRTYSDATRDDDPGRDPADRDGRVRGVRLPEGAGVRAVRPVPAHRQRRRDHRPGGRGVRRASSATAPAGLRSSRPARTSATSRPRSGPLHLLGHRRHRPRRLPARPRRPAGSPRTSRSTTPPASPRSSSRPWTPAPRRWSSRALAWLAATSRRVVRRQSSRSRPRAAGGVGASRPKRRRACGSPKQQRGRRPIAGGQAVDAEPVATTVDRGADQSGDGVEPAAQHDGNPPDQDVAQRAAAHAGDRSRGSQPGRARPQIQRLARARDGEQAQARGVQHVIAAVTGPGGGRTGRRSGPPQQRRRGSASR